MTTIELTEDGLQIPTQEELVTELADRLRARFGVNFRASDPKSIAGQLVHELCELRANDHQAFLAVYASMDPNGAAGRPLDARVGLTGTVRKGATSSYVTGLLTFAAVATYPAGSVIRNEDNSTLWTLDNDVTSAGAEDKAATFTCATTGPITAAAGTTWSLVTVVADVSAFANASDDANVGRDRETDAELRARRLTELYAQGQGPLDAIKGAVSQVDGVTRCRVYHNPSTSPVDADDIPFKAFNVVVETNPATPGAALRQSIADAIWSAMGAGGQAYGTSYTESVTDSEGSAQTIKFDVVADVVAYLEIDLVTTGSEDPVTPNIEDVVAAVVLRVALARYAVSGRDLRRIDYSGIVGAMLTAGTITGPFDVNVRMSIAPDTSPNDVDLVAVSIRQKPDFSAVNITIAQV